MSKDREKEKTAEGTMVLGEDKSWQQQITEKVKLTAVELLLHHHPQR